MNSSVSLRWISPTSTHLDDEIQRIDAVISRAYSFSTRADRVWRFLAAQPDGWIVAEAAGEVLSTGGCIAYPSGGFGWIGLIATDPDHRGKGLARMVTAALVDRLREHGCAAVLDGSESGAPLYERMGFVDFGLTRIFRPTDIAANQITAAESIGHTARTVANDDIDDLIAYDTPRFGADRAHLLRYLIATAPSRCLIMRQPGGPITGYAFSQNDCIGPMVADTSSDVCSLVNASLALPWASSPSMAVPVESRYVDDLVACGLKETRTLRHQRLGTTELPGQRHLLVSQASLGEG